MNRLLFILIVFTACKKENPGVEIKVTDITNGFAVPGAKITLYRCANLGCVFGTVAEFTGTTDGNGTVKVPQEKYDLIPSWNNATSIEAPKYWSEIFSKATALTLTPVGRIRLKIVAGTSYPAGSMLKFNTWRQMQPLNTAYPQKVNFQEFNAAIDSIVFIIGYGNQVNKIDWQVSDPTNTVLKHGTWNQKFPKLDSIINITLNY